MNPLERRSVAVLASIYGLRILGLFLVLPVLSVYAGTLPGHTPFRVGLALGAYGLTQAILQIPMGTLSDHIGRRPVIIAGLLVFALGSAIAAVSTTIDGVILGRAIQGAGAIAAAIMALVADLTREEQRTKAMALIGITIGASFVLSMILSPLLTDVVGVAGIFWLTSGLALAAIVIFLARVPTPTRAPVMEDRRWGTILGDAQLLRLDAGIFVLHLTMTAMFVVLPALIIRYTGLPLAQHWKLYLPVMLLALLGMAPFVRASRTHAKVRPLMMGAIAALILAEILYYFLFHRLIGIAIALWLFFTAFSVLEAMLPSLISRLAPVHAKGSAIGVYSTSQFLGAFVGGAGGGYLMGVFGGPALFLFSAAVLAVWFVLVAGMKEPRVLTSELCRLRADILGDPGLAERLQALPGMVEVILVPEERLAYLRVDPEHFQSDRLLPFQDTSSL